MGTIAGQCKAQTKVGSFPYLEKQITQVGEKAPV